MELKITPKYIVSFLFLTMLCGLSHEMVHHISAAAICGCWGYKTFNSFIICESCQRESYSYLATIAGPAFTFGLMWYGWYMLKSENTRIKRLGFALIFANFPINRILFSFLNMNDEQWVAKQLFGSSPPVYWITIFVVLVFATPPLLAAYKVITKKGRVLWFLSFFILPFIFVFLFAGLFLEEYLLFDLKILTETFLGIPYLLILVEILSFIGYRFTKKFMAVLNH